MDLAETDTEIVKGSEHYKSAREGKFAAEAWAFGGNRLFQDLNNDFRFLD